MTIFTTLALCCILVGCAQREPFNERSLYRVICVEERQCAN
jgi:hypothetical protein